MPRLLKIAIACGAAPLLVGTFIYLVWRITRSDMLIAAGFVAIAVGLMFFAVGIGCLAWQFSSVPRDEVDRAQRRRVGLFALILLLLNFPAAGVYAVSAGLMLTRYTVVIENDSREVIDSFVVKAPGVHAELGPIAPGQREVNHFRFHGDGELEFTASWQGSKHRDVLDHYVCPNMHGEQTVRFLESGKFEVVSSEPR